MLCRLLLAAALAATGCAHLEPGRSNEDRLDEATAPAGQESRQRELASLDDGAAAAGPAPLATATAAESTVTETAVSPGTHRAPSPPRAQAPKRLRRARSKQPSAKVRLAQLGPSR